MSTNFFTFADGVDAIPPFGQRWMIQFGGTWAPNDTWTILFVTTSVGNFTVGMGYFSVEGKSETRLVPTACFTYQRRVYLAMGKQFNFSATDDIVLSDGTVISRYSLWEIQDVGAGFELFTSQYGNQDTVVTFTQLQGKLVVIGHKTVQTWITDANPADFALAQILDHLGTSAVLSPANMGDLDALMLDPTGVRDIKTRQDTANAYSDDVGVAVDESVRLILQTYNMTGACSIVEPVQKNYWIYLGGVIFVLSRYPTAKIVAWSTFDPSDSLGNRFVPVKFVVFDGQVYCRTVERYHLQYGGVSRVQYDGSLMTVELPWLDDKWPKLEKLAQGIDAALEGSWTISAHMNPQSWNHTIEGMERVYYSEFPGGVESMDSTFDLMHIPYNQTGTHFKIIARTTVGWARRARISEVLYHYNKGQVS